MGRGESLALKWSLRNLKRCYNPCISVRSWVFPVTTTITVLASYATSTEASTTALKHKIKQNLKILVK